MKGSILNSSLSALEELTEKLPPFPEAISESIGHGYKEYQMDQGECFAWYIHRSGNDIAIHRWFNTKGTVFPVHAHGEKEWIIVYKGSMESKVGDTVTLVKYGESIYVAPDIVHSAYFPEDCKYITIMMPPAKEYPNGIG